MIDLLTAPINRAELERYGAELAAADDALITRCRTGTPWGLATAIDLAACNPRSIRDPQAIERFTIALCEAIAMRRFGAPLIVRFGADPRISGYSLAQLIETSLISGHFAEASDAAYLDIFSCKPYRPYQAARFCAAWFGAATARVSVTLRQA